MSFGVPVIILKEGAEEVTEKEARKQNINAMITISEMIKSTLGPKGMAKMIVDSMGDVTITNDGAEILKKLDIENAAALMMVNIAKSIDSEIGDGTTASVIFCGALLKNALDLVEQDIHPKHITHGYKLAVDKIIELVKQIATKINKNDDETLKNIARTAMNSKDIAPLKEFFADLALKAVKQIGDATFFDKVNNIKIVKAKGKSLKETQLISGVYVEKEKVDSGMPDIVKNAKIAVVRKKLDIKKTEFDAQIQIRNPNDIQKFLDQEEKILQNFVSIFKNLGVNVVVNNNDISDKIGAYLAKEGIAGIKNVGENDYKAILKATGANFIDDLKLMTENDLGFAEVVKFEKIGDNNYTFFEGCRDPKSVSIVIKGGIENVLSTAEIALNDVLHVLAKTLDTLTIVAGGGAIYIELAKRLKDYANNISGKEQLAINAFALALEEIPRTLIKNAGLDEIEKITELRAAHKTDKDKWIGIDTITNTIGDNYKKGIIEPAELIIHIVKSAGELATLILRVDRIISSKGTRGGGMPRPPKSRD